MSDPSSQKLSTRAIANTLQWLGKPAESEPSRELEALTLHLSALGEAQLNPEQAGQLVELLHLRAIAAVGKLRPQLSTITLPIPADARQAARIAMRSLEALAAAHSQTARTLPDAHLPLLHALESLSLHLLICALVASPPGVGIWQQMHNIYAQRLSTSLPLSTALAIDEIYFRAQLLACTQPASLAAQELILVDAAINAIHVLPERPQKPPPAEQGAFWINPKQDFSATAASRKPPPPGLTVWWFTCEQAALALNTLITALAKKQSPASLALPDFATSSSGVAALRRVVNCWSKPPKRRFNRRRQSLRATLLAGLPAIYELLRSGSGPTSEWIITNESPDGCAAMHVSGPTGRIDMGDVVALRFEGEKNWQLCLARWAQSENAEHLELGLQRLTATSRTATLVMPQLRANCLVFDTPGQAPQPTLMIAAGALDQDHCKAILLSAHHNLTVREVTVGACLERTPRVEYYALIP